MSRFDRRLKGADTKKPGSGAACVPQPIPKRGPLLSGMMFGGRLSSQTLNSVERQNQSLDNLVKQVDTTTNDGAKISYDNIEMIHRRLKRLENSNNISGKTNKVYESLDKRLTALEKMYSENMENMEKYVKNQEDRINLLTADYRKTLETLNKIIRDVNMKIVELDETCVKKKEKVEKIEEVTLEEPPKATIVAVKAKPVIKKEETNENVISEVTEEILSKVSDEEKQVKEKNVSLMIVEKEVSNEN